MAFLRHVDFRRSTASPISPTALRPGAFGASYCRFLCSEILATVGEALRLRLGHDDLTQYNAVQKILYLGVILVGIMIVISGLSSVEAGAVLRTCRAVRQFPDVRLVHFLCMAAIVGFLLVHVTLAFLVPQSLVAMVTGGPLVRDDAAGRADAVADAPSTPGALIQCSSHPHAVDLRAEAAN